MRTVLALALLTSAGACTRPKTTATTGVVPTATATPTVAPDALPTPDVVATAPSPTPTPVPTPVPTPRITLLEPGASTDFSRPGLRIAFTAEAPDGKPISAVRVLYDGRELGTLAGPGPLFRLNDWNPNVENNLANPVSSVPVPTGDHLLAFEASDELKRTARLEVRFFKPIALSTWREILGMPLPTSHHAVVSDGAEPPTYNTIWGSLDGIESSVAPRNQVFSFKPGGDGAWATLALNGTGLPKASFALAAHPNGQTFYLLGGRRGTSDLQTLDVYVPLRKTIEQTSVSLIQPRSDAAAVTLENYVYVFGGKAAGTPLTAVERVRIGGDGFPIGAFETRAPAINARVGAYAFAQGKEIWLIGGGHRPIEVYDTATNKWSLLTDVAGRTVGTPEVFSYAAVVPVGGRLFFFGGLRDDGQPTERIYEFDPVGRRWRDMGPLPQVAGEPVGLRPVNRLAAFYHAGSFYLTGGVTNPARSASNRVFRGDTL